MHLFDIDIPGKIYFKESTNLSAGNEFTTIDTRSLFFKIILLIFLKFSYSLKHTVKLELVFGTLFHILV